MGGKLTELQFAGLLVTTPFKLKMKRIQIIGWFVKFFLNRRSELYAISKSNKWGSLIRMLFVGIDGNYRHDENWKFLASKFVSAITPNSSSLQSRAAYD